jgi:hypothetical protein
LPIVGRAVAGSQGGSDENELYVFCLFHNSVHLGPFGGLLFNGNEYLIILFYADVFGVAI